MMFDLVLGGGTVVDGTGAPGYRADVGVGGETIAAIGDLGRAEARRVIDATGLVVAPGFVDPHTHAEGALLTDPRHPTGLRQGITTELLGIDGMSYAPLSAPNYRVYRRWLAGLLGDPPEDLDVSSVAAFRRHYHRTVAVNTAYLVPFATVRLEVLGFWDTPLRGPDLEAARRLVREGLEQGAVGFSSGSKYYPGPWGDTAELIALCEPVRAAGAVYMCEPRQAPVPGRHPVRRGERPGGGRRRAPDGRARRPGGAVGDAASVAGRRGALCTDRIAELAEPRVASEDRRSVWSSVGVLTPRRRRHAAIAGPAARNRRKRLRERKADVRAPAERAGRHAACLKDRL